MKHLILALPIVLSLLGGCEQQSPEESTIRNVLQSIEQGQKAESITPLKGGKSKADLFLITSTSGHQYVARFFSHANGEGRERIIKTHEIASQQGYGPHIFYTNLSDAVLVMDYLKPDIQNAHHTPEKMADLLKSIHQGPHFPSSWTLWDRTEQNLNRLEPHLKPYFLVSRIREALMDMAHQLVSEGKKVPCHRDLNPGNVIVSGGKYWAIDYDDASNDDPILDLALAGLLHNYTPQENQHLYQAYLGHDVSAKEQEKFDLCWRLAILFKATEMLIRLPENQWTTSIDITTVPALENLLSQVRSGTLSLDNPTNQLLISLAGIRMVLQ